MAEPSSKSPYSASFLKKQAERLKEERQKVIDEIDTDEAELLDWSGDVDGGDVFMSEDATALTERELELSLIENARHVLGQIDAAIKAIDQGTYGWDEKREVWIREARLEVLPWASEEVDIDPRKLKNLDDDDDLPTSL